MRQLRTLHRVPWDARCLLVNALVLVAIVRVALRLLPFRMLRPILARVTSVPRTQRRSKAAIVARIPWAVERAAAYVPGAACLTQALAAQILLARHGEPSTLRIGVARDERVGVRAHAWLEHADRVVLGAASVESFIPLPTAEEPISRAGWITTAAMRMEA